jgi:peptidoglycan/xylan/chitin deacetylase (PgdA/CDA1 family)
MHGPRVVLAVAVTGLLLSACGTETTNTPAASPDSGATPAASSTPSPATTPAATETPAAAGDPASVKANELGKIPVPMYHVIKSEPKNEYDQSPEDLRKELERLYEANYRPITMRDMVAGKIDIPAGMHPVVLTFDDSTASQAKIGDDGQPVADTGLGVMEAFNKAHPDWKSTATFYVNTDPAPFEDAKVLPWLVEHGYEVGSHTRSHANLKTLSDESVLKQVGGNVNDIVAALPGYKVESFARPFGIGPANLQLLHSGSYEGKDYAFTSVVLVGSNPAMSPFNTAFDPYAVARIRSGLKSKPVLMDSTYWLDSMIANPSSVYTSDGNADKISYPATSTAKIASKYADKANAYTASSTGSSTSSPTATPTTSATPAATTSPTS